MLRASALFYAVTVALLIAMVTGSLMLLAHFRNVEAERWLTGERARSNARSAVRLALVAEESAPVAVRALDLFGNGEDSAFLLVRPYGLLDHVVARARVGDRWVEQAAFIGGGAAGPQVLVLGRTDMTAVHLCGDARLLGDVVVPNADVRRGYIESRPFTGERLVEGQVQASTGDAVTFDDALLRRMADNCRRRPAADERTLSLERVLLPDTSADPFSGIPVVDLAGLPRLGGASFTGPLVLRSADTLTIGSDCTLDMVIVQAPFITVEAGASLTVQCFAERGIRVEQGAMLRYPSVLVLMANDGDDAASISIGRDAVVEGAVAASPDAGDRGQVLVSTALGSLVRGEIVVDGLLEHRGEVKGGARAEGLILHTASSTYRGYLLDGVLAPPDRAIAIGALATGGHQRKDVIKWASPVYVYRKDA